MLEFVVGYSMGKQPSPPPPSASRGLSGEGLSPATRIEDLEKNLDELALIVAALSSLWNAWGSTQSSLLPGWRNSTAPMVMEDPACCNALRANPRWPLALTSANTAGPRVRSDTGEPLNQF